MITESAFSQLVKDTLTETLAEEGLKLTGTGPYAVRFENSAVFVQPSYEPTRGRELVIWIGEVAQGAEPPFTLPDILRATSCDEQTIERAARTQTGDPEFLRRLLQDAASLLHQYATPFLRGDADAFAAAKRIRSAAAKEYTTAVIMAPILERADTAWRDRNYAAVAEILAPHEEQLDERDRRRLSYAQNRLRG